MAQVLTPLSMSFKPVPRPYPRQTKKSVFFFSLSLRRPISVNKPTAKVKSSPSTMRPTHTRRTHAVQDPIFSAITKFTHGLREQTLPGTSNICGVQTPPNLLFLKPQATYDPLCSLRTSMFPTSVSQLTSSYQTLLSYNGWQWVMVIKYISLKDWHRLSLIAICGPLVAQICIQVFLAGVIKVMPVGTR